MVSEPINLDPEESLDSGNLINLDREGGKQNYCPV